MDNTGKAFDLFWNFYNNDLKFKELISKNFELGKIRFFDADEYDKITSQNFISPFPDVNTFMELFIKGYNIGNCVGTARQLSYSYNLIDIVTGTLPMLKGTLNAEKEGGHCWLETEDEIIDTTFMLVIKKELKDKFGYIEEERLTAKDLRKMQFYQARKELVNDTRSINR